MHLFQTWDISAAVHQSHGQGKETTAGGVRASLAGPAAAERGTAVLGPSGTLVVMSGWMEKRLKVATTTPCRLCQTSASLFEGSRSYLYAAVHVKGLYTKVMTKEVLDIYVT